MLPGLLLAGVGIGLASTPITTAATAVPNRQALAEADMDPAEFTAGISAASQSTPASPWPRQPSRSSSAPTPARPGTDRDNDHVP